MKPVNIILCSCKKYLERDEWKAYAELTDLITKKVKSQLPKAKVIIKNLDIPQELKDKKLSVIVAKMDDKDHKVNITLKLSRCNMCSREGSNYFEAILQIRSGNNQILEEAVQFLQDRVYSMRHRGMFINKVDRLDNGFDLSLTNKKVAQMLSKEMQEYYGGKLKINPRIFSRNRMTSKDIYRVNILLELPSFTRGDIIVVNDKVCLVEKIGRKIKLTDLYSGSSMVMDYERMDYTVLHKHQTYVSRAYPTLEVINPHDYQSSMVKNKTKKVYTPGQTINVVIHKGIYVVD